eukprot:6756683-Prymnesium_polylepis.1
MRGMQIDARVQQGEETCTAAADAAAADTAAVSRRRAKRVGGCTRPQCRAAAHPAVEGGLVIGLRLLELLPLAAQRLRRRRAQVGGCGRVARLRSELGHLRNDVRVALGQ